MNPLRREPRAVYSVFDAEPFDGRPLGGTDPGDGQVDEAWEQAMTAEAAGASTAPTGPARAEAGMRADAPTVETAAIRAADARVEAFGQAGRRLVVPALLCLVFALVVGLVASTILKGPRTTGERGASAAGRPAGASNGAAAAARAPRVRVGTRRGEASTRRGEPTAQAIDAGRNDARDAAPRGERRVPRSGGARPAGDRPAGAGRASSRATQGRVPLRQAGSRARSGAAQSVATDVPLGPSPAAGPSPVTYVATGDSGELALPLAIECACESAIAEFGFER